MSLPAIQNIPKISLTPQQSRIWAAVAFTALAFAPFSNNAHATAPGFSGDYVLANWSQNPTGNPLRGASVTPNPTGNTSPVDSITITGPNTGQGKFEFVIQAVTEGLWSFHYVFNSLNTNAADNEAGYQIYSPGSAPVSYFLANYDSLFKDGNVIIDIVRDPLSGLLPMIGFYVSTEVNNPSLTTTFIIDTLTLPGQTPVSTPEPASLWLFAAGAIGISRVRRRRTNHVSEKGKA